MDRTMPVPSEDIFMEKTDLSQLNFKSYLYNKNDTNSPVKEVQNFIKFDVDPASLFFPKETIKKMEKAVTEEDVSCGLNYSQKHKKEVKTTLLAKRKSIKKSISNLTVARQYSALKSIKKLKYYWRGTERQSPYAFAKFMNHDSSGFFNLKQGDCVFEEDLSLKIARND